MSILMRTAFVLVAAPLLGACYKTIPLTPAGRQVELMKADPAPGCEELGGVSSSRGTGGRSEGEMTEDGKNDLRNKAAAMGANYIRWEMASTGGLSQSGTAYRCPDGTPDTSQPSEGPAFGDATN